MFDAYLQYYNLTSEWPPRDGGPLVTLEVSGHPHLGYGAHVCLCRSCHRAHSAHTKPTKHLSGKYTDLSTLRLFVFYSFNVFFSPGSISSGWPFWLWFLRSQRLLTGSSLHSRTTSVSGTSRLINKLQEQFEGHHLYLLFFYYSSLEVGSCIAVQVCMLQIPILVLFNAFYVSLHLFIYKYKSFCCFTVFYNRHNLSLPFPGCGICVDFQWPAPVGQHLQCDLGQLHLHGWQVWLFSG